MNKLISRNPVLRFKLGRKIVKALEGLYFRSPNNSNIWINKNTKKAYKSKRWSDVDPNNHADDFDRYFEEYDDRPTRFISLGKTYVRQGDNYYNVDSLGHPITLVSNPQFNWVRDALGNMRTIIKRTKPVTTIDNNQAVQQDIIVNGNKTGKGITKIKKSNNSPKFYGLTIGGKVLARGSNFNGLINDSLKQALLNAGFKNENFNDVLSFQKALNNFFLKDGAGSIKTDGMWGDQTLKAFNMALSKAGYDPSNKIALTPTTISNIYNQDKLKGLYATGLLKKPENPTIVPEGGISNFTPLSTAKVYNKSGIRDYIRNKSFNPYDFKGSQRKALRMVMNGQGTDEDRAIVKAMGLFKQGGQLPSRNIVKRFKNRKFN